MTRAATVVFVPLKYDLGGRVHDLSACRSALATFCGDVGEDTALTRSWNLSYLRRQGVVLRGSITDGSGSVLLAGVEWTFTRTLRIYPWLGVVSVDYWFHTEEQVSITAFYDDLVRWKNSDYVRYLYDSGELTSSLAAHVGVAPDLRPPGVELHGELVRDLRRRLREVGALEERIGRYEFHDFRTCFLVTDDVAQETVDSLLLLNRESAPPGQATGAADDISSLVVTARAGDVRTASTGWASVVMTAADRSADPRLATADPTGESQDLADILSIFDLIHAHWYVCQLWINVADRFLAKHTHDLDAHLARLRDSQRSLTRDLADAGDLGLMLKDPELLEVARYFEHAFKVTDHKDAAEVRLQLLDEAADEIDQRRRLESTDRLQILFALSAAGSLAALLPSLVGAGDQGSWLWAPTLLAVPLLWWIFSVGPRRFRKQILSPVRLLRRRIGPRRDPSSNGNTGGPNAAS